ncbi:CLUMA_CG009819, isoform A [Clunio marinus]|uniref:CLUMA_CG009819, isoform A n=1 Tax=Clunio marinus TaxID=568069 RepID=A0A1J1I9J4_9DIPT|nr:CLUMA_CG009819, isoform A [Clunio marinus]
MKFADRNLKAQLISVDFQNEASVAFSFSSKRRTTQQKQQFLINKFNQFSYERENVLLLQSGSAQLMLTITLLFLQFEVGTSQKNV